jgi:hypothetical protein
MQMKKTVKGGLVLAALLVGNAQAALVNVDLTGTVSYGYSQKYDYNWNTGANNYSYDDLSGKPVHFSFQFDTDKAYGYNDPWYSYSYANNAVTTASADVGGTSYSYDNLPSYGYSYNYYGSSWSELYGYNYSYTGNAYDYKEYVLYSSGNSSANATDFLSTFLTSSSPISFYLYNYAYDWSNDNYKYDYQYAYGTFTNFFVSPVGGIGASPSAVPVPAAVWLFGSALMGLAGLRKKKGMMPELSA